MPTTQTLLQVNAISKGYEASKPVLQDISLEVRKGESVAILGYSGAGKTTLLRLLGGLLEPDSGQVHFRGAKLPGPAEKLVPGHPDIRLVYQHFGLDHNLSVEQNLKHRMLGFKPEIIEKRCKKLLRWCMLDHLADRAVEWLSGGEKQRLALARAMADYPEVLLLDEPFSNIDLPLRLHFKRGLARFAKEDGFTMIMVTHDYQDAFQLADRIIVIAKGRLLRTGTPREIYEQPQYKVVAELLGAINIIKQEEQWFWLKEEHIQLKSRGKGWQGKIVGKIYLGDFMQYRIENEAGMELTAHVRDRDYPIGRSVSLAWEPSAMTPLHP
jgi:ABC-type Fe3+/spermidine/putrescine transport system ATPase subunit